jgi:hypothetical protein
MFAIRGTDKFMKVNALPIGFGRQHHVSIFNHVGDREHSHDLLFRGFVAGDSVHAIADQFLNELSPRCLIFDQNVRGSKAFILLKQGAFKVRISSRLRKP